jgi:hypothetical protein
LRPASSPWAAGLLVAGGAVDLAGEIEAGQALDGQRRPKLARIDVVVLDGVARTADLDIFQARDRSQERLLDLGRQRGRDAIWIDRVVIEAFGLEEDLVGRAVGEADDLVLDRGAIARADALDAPEYMARASRLAG